MKDTNEPASAADLERLASRLAMLASNDGEADNAGRAVGVMARRIGLSGGDLKRIFLAGAAGLNGSAAADDELSDLRNSLNMVDADARRAAWERDVLRVENGRLKASLDRWHSRLRVGGLAGAAAVLMVLFVAATAWIGESRPDSSPWVAQGTPAEGQGVRRAAIVRTGGALLFGQPERSGPPLIALRAGQRLQVRRLVWKALFQWAEVEAPGGWMGYVLTTEIDLP